MTADCIELERRRQYAAFLQRFSWSWWMTFTFELSHSWIEGRRRLEEYLRTLEAMHKDEFSCVICPEWTSYSGCGKPGGRLHFHVLLGCARTYDPEVFKNLWLRKEFGGRRTKGPGLHVKAYDRSRGPVSYMFKWMKDPRWDYEPRNLELISPVIAQSVSATSQSRRRIRRYQERCELARKEGTVERTRLPRSE